MLPESEGFAVEPFGYQGQAMVLFQLALKQDGSWDFAKVARVFPANMGYGLAVADGSGRSGGYGYLL